MDRYLNQRSARQPYVKSAPVADVAVGMKKGPRWLKQGMLG